MKVVETTLKVSGLTLSNYSHKEQFKQKSELLEYLLKGTKRRSEC